MFKKLETNSITISKFFFSSHDFIYHLHLRRNKKIIKTSQFKKVYIDEINSLYKKINEKHKILPSIDEVPCLFLSFIQDLNYNWELFCEQDFYQVGLCDRYPINQLILELKTIIDLVELEGLKLNLYPLHINLRIHHEGTVHTHANTIIMDFKNKDIYLIEPKGNFNNFLNYLVNFNNSYHSLLIKLANKIKWSFRGYLVNNCNFQGSNNDNCYLWTSWFEITCLLNYMNNIKNLRRYFKHQYLNKNNYPFCYLISHYLLELYLEK